MNLHGSKVRISIVLEDESGKPIAAKHSFTPVGAADTYDVIANVERSALQTSQAITEQLGTLATGGKVIVLDIREVDNRNAIGFFLREKAKELEGFTLYHPQHDLQAWADDIDPPLEELRRRAAEYQAKPRKSLIEAFRDFQAAQLAELAKLVNGDGATVTPLPTGNAVAQCSAQVVELTRLIEQERAAAKPITELHEWDGNCPKCGKRWEGKSSSSGHKYELRDRSDPHDRGPGVYPKTCSECAYEWELYQSGTRARIAAQNSEGEAK